MHFHPKIGSKPGAGKTSPAREKPGWETKRERKKENRKRWLGACIHWPATSSARWEFRFCEPPNRFSAGRGRSQLRAPVFNPCPI